MAKLTNVAHSNPVRVPVARPVPVPAPAPSGAPPAATPGPLPEPADHVIHSVARTTLRGECGPFPGRPMRIAGCRSSLLVSPMIGDFCFALRCDS